VILHPLEDHDPAARRLDMGIQDAEVRPELQRVDAVLDQALD
jgi:hypothetical protein